MLDIFIISKNLCYKSRLEGEQRLSQNIGFAIHLHSITNGEIIYTHSYMTLVSVPICEQICTLQCHNSNHSLPNLAINRHKF